MTCSFLYSASLLSRWTCICTSASWFVLSCSLILPIYSFIIIGIKLQTQVEQRLGAGDESMAICALKLFDSWLDVCEADFSCDFEMFRTIHIFLDMLGISHNLTTPNFSFLIPYLILNVCDFQIRNATTASCAASALLMLFVLSAIELSHSLCATTTLLDSIFP
jgi:hypothetical protein